MNHLPGWMTDAELAAIDDICKLVPLGAPVLEIGSFLGRSTIQWAARLPASRIICVDTWQGYPQDYIEDWYLQQCHGDHRFLRKDMTLFRQFLRNTRRFTNVYPMRVNSREFEWVWAEPPGVIFIDGDHTDEGVKADLEAVYTRWHANSDTIICGHDYNTQFNNQVKRMLEPMAAAWNKHIENPINTTIFLLKGKE